MFVLWSRQVKPQDTSGNSSETLQGAGVSTEYIDATQPPELTLKLLSACFQPQVLQISTWSDGLTTLVPIYLYYGPQKTIALTRLQYNLLSMQES